MNVYMDRLSSQDAMTLSRYGALFCLFTWGIGVESSKWNLPVYLFGIVAHEMSGFSVWQQFIQILFPSMILDGFSLLLASTDFLSFILSIVGIVLKISLYFSGRRVLLEKGGQSMGGFASLDPRGGFNGFSSGGGGRGQVLGQSENAGNQTIFSMPGALSSPTTQSGQNPAAHFSGNGFTLGSDEDAADQGQGHSTTKTGMPGRGGYQALP